MLLIDLETFLVGMLINLLICCSKLVYNVCIFGCVRFCVRYYSKGRGLTAPFFLWLAYLARPVSGLDRFLAGVVVDRVLWRYLLRPAAGDPMKRLLVDAGHVLWSGQDGSRQEQNCKKRESEALGHGGLL